MWLVGRKPISLNVIIPTTSFSRVLCHRKFVMIGVNECFFCVNDVMCRTLWHHLSSLLYRGGLTALSVLHKFEGLIDSTSHNYWYLRNPPPLQALQINHERDSALKRMGSLETSGRREAFFFRIFVARLTCIVKKKAPRLPRAPRRSHAQTNKGRGILGSSSKRRFVCLKQEAT